MSVNISEVIELLPKKIMQQVNGWSNVSEIVDMLEKDDSCGPREQQKIKLNWSKISTYQKLSEKFIEKISRSS